MAGRKLTFSDSWDGSEWMHLTISNPNVEMDSQWILGSQQKLGSKNSTLGRYDDPAWNRLDGFGTASKLWSDICHVIHWLGL